MHGRRDPSGPGEVERAAKVLLDRRDRRELLELRERLQRQPEEGAGGARVVYVDPAPAQSSADWHARVERELANVRGSAKRH